MVHALKLGICSRVYATACFGKSLLQQRLGQWEDQQCFVGLAWTRSERTLHTALKQGRRKGKEVLILTLNLDLPCFSALLERSNNGGIENSEKKRLD